MTPFGTRLAQAIEERGRFCVGIDPHAALLHEWGLDDDVASLERFALTVVEAVAPVVGVVKPQWRYTMYSRSHFHVSQVFFRADFTKE